MLKYKYIFQIKYTEAILSDSTRKLLWFDIFLIIYHFFLTIAMSSSGVESCDHSSPNIDVIYPRWDKADTAAYYGETGVGLNLAPVLQDLDRLYTELR